jgi:hypothetical protein
MSRQQTSEAEHLRQQLRAAEERAGAAEQRAGAAKQRAGAAEERLNEERAIGEHKSSEIPRALSYPFLGTSTSPDKSVPHYQRLNHKPTWKETPYLSVPMAGLPTNTTAILRSRLYSITSQ